MRRGLVWVVSVPLLVAGTEAAHALAYRIAYPDPVERSYALAASGHGYLAHLPLALAVGLALAGCALALHGSRARRGALLDSTVPARAFAVLPPVTFALQEHLERLLHGGGIPFDAVLEPTFLLGVVLQLPFALLAYLLVRLLLGAAERIGVRLRPAPRRAPSRPATRRRPPPVALPRLAPLAAGASGRGPPGR